MSMPSPFARTERAAQAWKEGRFKRSVIPVTDVNGLVILDHDETIAPAPTCRRSPR